MFELKPLAAILVLLCCLLSGVKTQAQLSYSPIMVSEKGLFHKKIYTRCEVDMNADQLLQLLAKDPRLDGFTVPLAKLRVADRLLLASGTVLLSLPLVDALQRQGNPNWTLAYIGGGLLAASIPFRIAFQRRASRAIAYYNSGCQKLEASRLSFTLAPNQVALVWRF